MSDVLEQASPGAAQVNDTEPGDPWVACESAADFLAEERGDESSDAAIADLAAGFASARDFLVWPGGRDVRIDGQKPVCLRRPQLESYGAVPLSGAMMEKEKLSHCWAPRAAVVGVLRKLGCRAMPSDWYPPNDSDVLITADMIARMTDLGPDSYVPLCSVLLWIMTDRGQTERTLQDSAAWAAAADDLRRFLNTGAINVSARSVGSGKVAFIDPLSFSDALFPCPLEDSSHSAGDDPWILCYPPINPEHRSGGFNDQFFPRKLGDPQYTHLQVLRSEVLAAFPEHSTFAEEGSFTPFPNRDDLQKKTQIAFDVMQTIWSGVPTKDYKSAQEVANKLNTAYAKLGWSKTDGRGKLIKTFSEDDVKRLRGTKE
jgi:hypothetical protein